MWTYYHPHRHISTDSVGRSFRHSASLATPSFRWSWRRCLAPFTYQRSLASQFTLFLLRGLSQLESAYSADPGSCRTEWGLPCSRCLYSMLALARCVLSLEMVLGG